MGIEEIGREESGQVWKEIGMEGRRMVGREVDR